MPFERSIIVALQSVASDGLTAFFEAISLLGSWYGFIITFLVFLFFSRRFALCFGGTFLGGVAFNYLLKVLIDRPRPYETYSNIISFSDAMGQSMPSNHAFCATVIAIFICFFVSRMVSCKWVKGACYAIMSVVVILVGISRMYLGVHYISDIVAGITIGALLSIAGLKIYQSMVKRVEI